MAQYRVTGYENSYLIERADGQFFAGHPTEGRTEARTDNREEYAARYRTYDDAWDDMAKYVRWGLF